MNMFRTTTLACLVALPLAAGSAQAHTYDFNWTSGFANGGLVPDGNPTGWSDTRTLSGLAANSILDLTVTLSLSGGWNGDLYAYLTDGTGFSVLLNRVGVTASDSFGYADSGLNVTFSDTAANGDIHGYQRVPGYSASITDGSAWAPDGRLVNPLSVLDTDPRTASLSSFDASDPNGSWTLFVADLSSGDLTTVENWGLHIDAQPSFVSVSDRCNTGLLFGLTLLGLAPFVRRAPNPGR